MMGLLLLMIIGLLTTGWRPRIKTHAVALLTALVLAGFVGGMITLSGALGLAVLGLRKGRSGAIA